MANIKPYIEGNNSLSSPTIDGRNARTIIVNCLEVINQEGPDAQTFQGLTEDKYAKSGYGIGSMQYKMNAIYSKIHKDDKPDLSSDNVLMTKGITSLIGLMSQYETS